jgi:hypothetical protein
MTARNSWSFKYIVTCLGTLSLYVTWLRYLSLLNTNCNVLGYWRHRSVCYTSLFTTSLVVTTVSVYNVLGPSDVVSRSGPGSSALVLRSSLISVSGRSFDLSSVISLLFLSSVICLLCSPSVCVRLSAAPEVGCLCPGKKTHCPRVLFPVLALLRFPTVRLLGNS